MSSKTTINHPKKVNKKKRIMHLASNVLSLILIIVLFILVISVTKSFLNKENKNKDKGNKGNQKIEEQDTSKPEEQDNNKQEEQSTSKPEEQDNNKQEEQPNSPNQNEEPTSSEDKKLKELDYVNKKLSYFKMENIDRYLAYKEKNPNLSNEKVVLYVNIGIDQPFYTNIKPSPRQNTNTILTNKFYQVSSNYVPKDLELIDSKYQVGGKKMTHDAAVAFNEMAAAAKEQGYTIRAVSTYRSYDYQKNLYNNYTKKDGKTKADTYSARPGHSEHQTGLAADIDNAKLSYTSFGKTNEFSWMKEHSWEYGFILRYTAENEFLTGYKDEPWHYRYVGLEIAKQMHDENISSYEEYYAMYLDK